MPSAPIVQSATPIPSPTPFPPLALEPPDHAQAQCQNSDVGYVATYPASWYVHPSAPDHGWGECQLFGPSEFFVGDSLFPHADASIGIVVLGGPCLEYDASWGIDGWARYAIDGYPTLRIDAAAGNQRDRAYFVNLRPELGPAMWEPLVISGKDEYEDCEDSLGLWLFTRDGMAGEFEDNRAVLDQMAATLDVTDR